MALGEKLCNARLALKQSTSEVAAGTRMKVQTVEYLEREEFNEIPAPIYAKGFIKLYAEHVGLDPQPLIDEFQAHFGKARRSALAPDGQPRVRRLLHPEKSDEDGETEEQAEADLFDAPASSETPQEFARPAGGPSAFAALLARMSNAASGIFRRAATRAGAASGEEPRNRLGELLARLSWRSPAAVGAGLIVLAGLATVVTQCERDKPSDPHEPVPREELRLAIEPPDPYLD